MLELGGQKIVSVFISCESSLSERRFDKSISILELKEKLEPITGVNAATCMLSLFNSQNELIASLNDDSKMLGYYNVIDFMRIEVKDLNPNKIKSEYTDVSRVEKFEISQAEYEKKTDSVRAFKQRHKIGRFSDNKQTEPIVENDFKIDADKCQVGDRCQVETVDGGMKKRGVIKYVGLTEFKTGYWVGVEYDEPVGKHNGSVGGKKYFEARPNSGAFIRPSFVEPGDFPEIDLFDDDEM